MISLEYIAGFFDGEGCVNLSVTGKDSNVALRVMIVNTEADILAELQTQFGGVLSKPKILKRGWKPFRSVRFNGHEAVRFLRAIQPFARLKARQIALALEFWEFRQRPNDERYDFPMYHDKIGRERRRRFLKPEVWEVERSFKAKMHELNRKGTLQ